MNKIWQKNENQVNKIIEKYNTGEDYIMDMIIMPYDIHASLAHAEMLKKIITHKFKRIFRNKGMIK